MNEVIQESIWMIPYLEEFRNVYGDFQISIYNSELNLIYEYNNNTISLKHNLSVLKLTSVNLSQNEVYSEKSLTICNPLRNRSGLVRGYVLFSCSTSFDIIVLKIIVTLFANQTSLLSEFKLSEELKYIEKCISESNILNELSEREGEIVQLIARGKSDTEIISLLKFSKSTLRAHIKNVFNKLDVCSRSELISRYYTEILINGGKYNDYFF